MSKAVVWRTLREMVLVLVPLPNIMTLRGVKQMVMTGDFMQPRIDFSKAAPGALQAMMGLEMYVRECGLEPSLLELVKLRASQINGCA